MRDQDIIFLAQRVKVGTPVWIVPERTEIIFGLAASTFGSSIVSTPSLNAAVTRSAVALAGSVKERLKLP